MAVHRPFDPFTLNLKLLGQPVQLGQIVCTTTKNNHDTAVPFNNTGDALTCKVLELQADGACYIKFGAANTITATTSAYDKKLEAGQSWTVVMTEDKGFIAALAVSGTVTVNVTENK